MSANRRIKVWRDANSEWRWTYWASSDRIATSGEGFKNKGHVLEQIASLYPDVPVVVEEEGGA